MGSLHAGHLALIEAAAARCEVVVVSIFVNRMQFGSAEDFEHYPRDLAGDVERALAAGASLVFTPDEVEMLPGGTPVVTVDPGSYGTILEGRSRPGHFRGVATIVTKLLALIAPKQAFFGEKDYEQLTVIRRLVTDLGFPVDIVAVPTVRETDGLALSSRNLRLSAADRSKAPVLYQALQRGADYFARGGRATVEVEAIMAETVAAVPGVVLDYATARDALSLAPVERLDSAARLLIAAQIGPVRLIDNIAVGG
jgi:pantoate--beta-alanine ligase